MTDHQNLWGDYLTALQTHFGDRSETALSRAYEIGRRAIAEGLGLLEVAAMHDDALVAVGGGEPRLARAAADFFRELLSPFEMSFRGYREANDQLTTLNATLLKQREALEAVNRELEAFSYSVSHDLRAPLRSIDGFSQALLEDFEDKLDASGKRYLQNVRESAQQMAQLIDDLLGLARVTRSELHSTEVDLSAVARRIVERLSANSPGRAVEVAIAEGLKVRADGRLMAVALENLLGNAWKFTGKRERPRLELGVDRRGPRPVYFVRDNGAGFDMNHAAKLFGAFQRLHSAGEFEGTGVGLATVQRVIHRHGGKIWAEGEVQRGATFFFTLGEDRE
jgi:light-regulated signal transduction histidine kinase (bacteriophytochrome)